MTGKKYIYSVELANKFIQLGYKCLGTGYNAKSERFWWCFDYNEVQEYYSNK